MVGGKVAHFDRIEWRVIPDSATAAAALQAGEVDWYEQVQPDLVPLLRRNRDIRIGSHNPTGYNGVLRFNHLHPPFNNVAVRRAVIMGVNQADYMASVTGGDATAYATCKSMFPCGSHYGLEVGADAMQGDVAKAKAMLQASGYNGEKVVLLNPTDLTTVGPLGDVTHDLLLKIGMNVEMVATDWGTVVQRRVSREPVEKGGWSILHTWAPSTIRFTPVEHSQIRGLGADRVVRLVQGRHDGGADSPLRGGVDPEGARRDGAGDPPACVRDGALHTAGHVPDPHRLSQQPDRGDRGDGSVFLERQAGLIDSRPPTFAPRPLMIILASSSPESDAKAGTRSWPGSPAFARRRVRYFRRIIPIPRPSSVPHPVAIRTSNGRHPDAMGVRSMRSCPGVPDLAAGDLCPPSGVIPRQWRPFVGTRLCVG